jgi:phenylacetate-CoA ligase
MESQKLIDEKAQQARLVHTVPRWLAEVPLYQHLAPTTKTGGLTGDFWRIFRSLPTITKQDIRQGFPHNFLPAEVDLESLLGKDLVELEQTSGTSEEPIPLLLAQGWWQIQEQAALRLNGWIARHLSSTTRRVTLASPVCTHEISYKAIPSCSERTLGQSRYVNLSRFPFLWSEPALERMVEETQEWEPCFFDVDPVYGVLFARYCEHQAIRFPSVKFILSSYEYLSVMHRRILQRVFGVPVFNLYGSTETGHLLMETEHGEMVPSLVTAYLELLHPDASGLGELVVTTLTNDYMPLIRYRIGDLVCRTQHSDRTTYELHGRVRDAVLGTSGHRITVAQIDQCFAGLDGILHYQLLQESATRYTLFYVAEPEKITPATLARLQSQLSDLLATADGLHLCPVDYLPCETSGKFRLSYRDPLNMAGERLSSGVEP